MSSPISTQTSNRAGLCPHGLPPAACPICSGGMASGGGGRMKDAPATKPMNSGEWSWIKCYAAGLAIKAQEARIENSKTAFEKQIEFAKELNKSIQNLSDRIKMSVINFQNSLPNSLSNFVAAVSKVIIMPVLNIIAQIPKIIEKLAQFQQNLGYMLLQAGEKLTALLGDIKNFLNKKLFEDTKKLAKKIFMFFVSNTEDENYQNDDTLAVFKSRELRKFIVKILKRDKKRDKNAD